MYPNYYGAITQTTMEPLMYPDFHVKNDRFLFPLDLPWLYSKFYGTAYLQDLFHSIFYFVVFYIYSSFFFPSQMSYIIYLDGVCHIFSYFQDLIHSIFSSFLSFLINSSFFLSIQYTLSLISLLCCYRFSHFQDLIHSFFSFVVF